MNQWPYFLLCTALFAAAMYLLYRRGLAVTKRIAAVLFAFRPGKSEDYVSLNACSGWVRHAGRFRESRLYRFSLDAELSAGEAEVLLLDRDRRQLLRLDRRTPIGEMELDGRSRYYLQWEFKSATGRCALRW